MSQRPHLLFLPGLVCDAELWAHQLKHLQDLADTHVADLTQDDNIADMARRAAAAVPGRFVAVGLSMGGYVAFELLRAFADRIDGVALLDTSAAPDTPEKAAERRDGIKDLTDEGFAEVASQLASKLIHPDRLDGPVAAQVHEMALRVGREAYVRQQKAIIGRIDSRPSLGAAKVPALVVVGEQDKLTPPDVARVIHEGIEGSQLQLVARCGHLPPLEEPEETTAILRKWLSGQVL